MIIKYKRRKIRIDAHKVSELGKYIGLMFRDKESKNLLFEFNKECRIGIHSFFVFFPFLIIWLDAKNNVIEFRIIKPFNFFIRPAKNFRRFIEVPLNLKNLKIIKHFF